MDALSTRLAQQYPAENKDWGALVVPLQEDLVGDARLSLLVLLGAVALVLLIACANLANLLLVRTHGRAREIALRGALGASRGRVMQQLLAEGLLLGLGGGAVGFAAASYGVDVLVGIFGSALPRAQEIAVDGRVLAFTAGLVGAHRAAGGVLSRLAVERPGRQRSAQAGRQPRQLGGSDGRLRQGLVVSEVALALMLLIGAGLLMRSLTSLRAVDPGFDARNVLTASVGIPMTKYDTELKRNQFFDGLRQRRALPGVESAALVDSLPFQGGSTQYVAVEGAPPVQDSEKPTVAVRLPSPGYFATARIPIGRPRLHRRRRVWPPRGDNRQRAHRAALLAGPEPARQAHRAVDDVRRDARGRRCRRRSEDERARRRGRRFRDGALRAGRTVRLQRRQPAAADVGAAGIADHGDGRRGAGRRQRTAGARDPDAGAAGRRLLGQRPTAMWLLAAFAGLALALASVGVYSVLAYTVRQRVREIGIRLALGAPSAGVLRMVVLDGLKPTLAGVVLGLVLAAALVRVMETLLFGVSAHDPGTFSLVAAIVVVVGLVATLVPAWRATRVDPIVTLRAE